MEINFVTFISLGIVCFLAAFVDSIAGGGGLISLPAYMAVGIPPHIALGTNKFSAMFSSLSSSFKFWRAGKVNISILKKLIPFSFLGAIVGVKVVLILEQKYLYPIAFILLIFTICYTIYNKKLGDTNNFSGETKENILVGITMAFFLGFYDGFFGPGTGSFLIFLLIKIFKFDFINASGNSKILNLGSNLASVGMFVYAGKVNYVYALSMALFMVIGAQVGSRFAIMKGSKFIKPFFLIITIIVALKMATQFIDFSFWFNKIIK